MSETYDVPPRVRAGSRSPIQSLADWRAAWLAARDDPDATWLRETTSRLAWKKAPSRGLEGSFHDIAEAPIRWFSDGELNITESCLDRHLATRGDKIAILWEGDEPGAGCQLSYRELHQEVCRAAGALRAMGVQKGERVIIYMGMVPEAAIAMLACARLGAVHSVVFGGFSAEALRDRVRDCERPAELGVRHVLVDSHELEREGYAANSGDRCYFCKTELFELARDRAATLGIPWVVDGTITDDLGAHRPGLKAAEENAVRHVLVEAGFDKHAVRDAAHHMGLPVWDKPSFACLGSRFPVGTRVTGPRLQQVQRVESLLRTLGLRHFRARWHELEGVPMVRLELGQEEIPLVTQPGIREAIVDACKAEGFRWVTLDLVGYRTGGDIHLPVRSAARDPREALP